MTEPEHLDLDGLADHLAGEVDASRHLATCSGCTARLSELAGVDHLVLESTYGDRVREDMDLAHRRALLAKEVRAAQAAGGPLLMPTFAIGRAQELILDLLAIMEAEPDLATDIFLDSPLAIETARRSARNDAAADPVTPSVLAT